MTREQRLREEWEAVIPREWETMLVSDAHRAINRGRRQELISKSSLYRLVGAGEMGAHGGPGTGVLYRFRRTELIDYLVRLDVTLSDRHPRERAERQAQAVEVAPPPPATPTSAPRPRRRRPTNGTLSQQQSLFDEEE